MVADAQLYNGPENQMGVAVSQAGAINIVETRLIAIIQRYDLDLVFHFAF
jgi:hypothetical protein